MLVMAALTSGLYVAVRKITRRRAAPDWLRSAYYTIVS